MILGNLICAWNILDDSHKILLGNCLIIFGVIGLGLNMWLFITFLQSPFVASRSYLFLLANCVACVLRGLLVFPFESFSALFTRWIFGFGGCQLFAFLKLMVGIFQMACFTILSIERLISVKYYEKGSEIPFKFYMISIVACWLFSISIASLPLIGFGRYEYDTTCTFCELDWKIKDVLQMGFNISFIVIAGICTITTCVCSCTAVAKERRILVRSEYRSTTKAVVMMIVLTLLFWLPRAILICWIPFVKFRIPKALAVMAPLCAEASAIIPVLTYLVYLPKLRTALLTVLAMKGRNV